MLFPRRFTFVSFDFQSKVQGTVLTIDSHSETACILAPRTGNELVSDWGHTDVEQLARLVGAYDICDQLPRTVRCYGLYPGGRDLGNTLGCVDSHPIRGAIEDSNTVGTLTWSRVVKNLIKPMTIFFQEIKTWTL